MKRNKIVIILFIVVILCVKLFVAGELFQQFPGSEEPSVLLVKKALAEVPVRDVLEDPLSRERALMKTLEQKEQELNDRESRLSAEEQRTQALKQEIVAKIETLKALEERLGASLEEEKTSENKRYKDLAKVYDAAPPDKVGSMLEKMDTKTAAGITMNMKRDKAGAVLGYLSPQKAIEITREITRVSGKTPSVP